MNFHWFMIALLLYKLLPNSEMVWCTSLVDLRWDDPSMALLCRRHEQFQHSILFVNRESLRLREEISEDKLEKKMEIYMEAMQKSKKRRLENDDEEYVPKHLLQAEKAKVLVSANRILTN